MMQLNQTHTAQRNSVHATQCNSTQLVTGYLHIKTFVKEEIRRQADQKSFSSLNKLRAHILNILNRLENLSSPAQKILEAVILVRDQSKGDFWNFLGPCRAKDSKIFL